MSTLTYLTWTVKRQSVRQLSTFRVKLTFSFRHGHVIQPMTSSNSTSQRNWNILYFCFGFPRIYNLIKCFKEWHFFSLHLQGGSVNHTGWFVLRIITLFSPPCIFTSSFDSVDAWQLSHVTYSCSSRPCHFFLFFFFAAFIFIFARLVVQNTFFLLLFTHKNMT